MSVYGKFYLIDGEVFPFVFCMGIGCLFPCYIQNVNQWYVGLLRREDKHGYNRHQACPCHHRKQIFTIKTGAIIKHLCGLWLVYSGWIRRDLFARAVASGLAWRVAGLSLLACHEQFYVPFHISYIPFYISYALDNAYDQAP